MSFKQREIGGRKIGLTQFLLKTIKLREWPKGFEPKLSPPTNQSQGVMKAMDHGFQSHPCLKIHHTNDDILEGPS